MNRKTLIATITAAVLLGGLVFTLSSSASGENKKIETPACCKSYKKECVEGQQKSGSGELIMENMSRQFISI